MKRSFKHWTPRYLFDRLGVAWFEWRNPEAPWLTPAAVEFLNSTLKKESVGFEWGSGRSTTWLASRVKHLTSVEHDPVWFAKVQRKLEEKQLRNVDCILESELALKAEAKYVRAIEKVPDASLDFVLIDGELREYCANQALEKLKAGGIFILDNANWYLPCASRSPNSCRSLEKRDSALWKNFLQKIHTWRSFWTSSGVTDTALWVKP